MFGYFSLDIICSSKLTVFLELRSRKTVRLSAQTMSADKCPSIFSGQMETIVYIPHNKTSNKIYLLSLWCVSILIKYHFQISFNLKVILNVAKIPSLSSFQLSSDLDESLSRERLRNIIA